MTKENNDSEVYGFTGMINKIKKEKVERVLPSMDDIIGDDLSDQSDSYDDAIDEEYEFDDEPRECRQRSVVEELFGD